MGRPDMPGDDEGGRAKICGFAALDSVMGHD
jgi:hypothetical protein